MDIATKVTKATEAILNAVPWRCFHCDFITTDPKEAQAHFGDRDDASEFTPTCKWWLSMPDSERAVTLQDTVKQLTDEQDHSANLSIQVEALTYQVEAQTACIQSYKPFRSCRTINDVFCLFDSMEGRALAAEEQLKEK